MIVQSYLIFEGRAREAMAFYARALGGKVDFQMTFDESPEKEHNPPGVGDKIMHASMMIGDTQVMLSDGMCVTPMAFQGFSLALTKLSVAEAEQYFKALSEGGEVTMPLTPTFWSPMFGMLKDRFGVHWMVVAEGTDMPGGG